MTPSPRRIPGFLRPIPASPGRGLVFAWLAAVTACLAVAACEPAAEDRPATLAPPIRAVSTHPDRVSGGDVLLEVTEPSRGAPSPTVLLNGDDVSADFAPDPNQPGRHLGLVDGLRVGENTLEVRVGERTVEYTVTNYPVEGPIISGPHQEPFVCQTEAFTLPDGTSLGPPVDDDCSVEPRVDYFYLAVGEAELQALPDSTDLPDDVAMTTTTAGATVPFVVRLETATVDRGIYQSAVLFDPTRETAPNPLSPPAGWNRRLIAVEGFGCPGGWYIQGDAQGNLAGRGGMDFRLLSPRRLGEGYALYTNTLQHPSNNCNAVLASEAAMMSKERFVETYGVPDFTVSAGCSGGSYGSAQPAARIPGLFDGILIACTFPDPLSIALSGSDGHLLTHYWAETNPTGFTDAQKAAVTGYKSVQAFVAAANQAGRTDPVPGRRDVEGYESAVWDEAVPRELRYHPDENPDGARPTVYDVAGNVYGVDPETGFALRPFDNVGVQYGWRALNEGVISVDQFLHLNENVGGYDADANYTAERSVGDPGAMERAHRSGLHLGGGGGLASIPVFDITGIYNEDDAYHYQWFHFALRERMLRANGDTDNHVMWRGDPVPFDSAWSAFVGWVEAYTSDAGDDLMPAEEGAPDGGPIAGDRSAGSETRGGGSAAGGLPQRERVIRNRPPDLVDGCWTGGVPSPAEANADPDAPARTDQAFLAERQELGHPSPRSGGSVSRCNELFPSWTFPREAAGGPVAADILKCALRPPAREDYAVELSDAQWERLQSIFPDGVCDWSRPGVHSAEVVPHGSFGPAPDPLVLDGRPNDFRRSLVRTVG